MGDLSPVLCFEGAFPPFSLSFHMFQGSQWAFLVSLSSNPLCFGDARGLIGGLGCDAQKYILHLRALR